MNEQKDEATSNQNLRAFTIVIADLSIDLFIVVFCLINLCTYVMADFEFCLQKILKKSLGFILAKGAASSPIIHIYRISNSIKTYEISPTVPCLPVLLLDHRRPHRPLVVELAKDAWQDVADVPQQMPVQRLLRLYKEFLMRDEREDDGMETLMFLDRGQNGDQLDCQLKLQVQQLENMETVVVNEVQGLDDQAQVNDEDALDVVYVTWDEVKNEQQLQMLLDVQQPQVPSAKIDRRDCSVVELIADDLQQVLTGVIDVLEMKLQSMWHRWCRHQMTLIDFPPSTAKTR
ncbi:hypothetical protein GQX74_015696 [Glossina fuscipes]|nr:hypothetical protein GQX74_015696 [Glossina fuscipes]